MLSEIYFSLFKPFVKKDYDLQYAHYKDAILLRPDDEKIIFFYNNGLIEVKSYSFPLYLTIKTDYFLTIEDLLKVYYD